MMPGLGSSVACFVAYGEEKRRSKEPEKWGTGIVEGIAAPESANNAVSGPSMIPLLTLGIPGSTVAAVLIGVFLIHGIQVGPAIFDSPTSRELIYGLFAAGLLGIVAYGVMGYWGGPIIGRAIAYLPAKYLYPGIFLTAVRGGLFEPREHHGCGYRPAVRDHRLSDAGGRNSAPPPLSSPSCWPTTWRRPSVRPYCFPMTGC